MNKVQRLERIEFKEKYRLLLLIKSLHKKDSAPMRQAIYHQYVEFSALSKILKLYEVLPIFFQRILLFVFSIKFMGEVIKLSDLDCDEVAVWERFPERNHISMIPIQGKRIEYQPEFSFIEILSSIKKISLRDIKRYWQVLDTIARRYGLLSALRSAEVICKSFLNSSEAVRAKRIFVSSDASPLALSILLGFKGRAQIIHTPHGIVPNSEHLIYFDVNYYTTKYNYLEMGRYCSGENRYIGNSCEVEFKVPSKAKVGIIISIIPSEKGINQLIARMNALGVTPCVKLHPNVIGVTKWSGQYEIVDNLDECTIIISGNSGHIIKMLKKGVFVAFEPSLDTAPLDIYKLKERGVVAPYSEENLLSFDYYKKFYSSPEWKKSWDLI